MLPSSQGVVCPSCQRRGATSMTSKSTAAYFPPFIDKDGQEHHHDGNRIETDYTCVCGATWTMRQTKSKCWCGWPAKGATKEAVMAEGRFDYVRYDKDAQDAQGAFKEECTKLEKMIEQKIPKGRAQSLALTSLEECYMWIGKAIRDDQIARNGSAPLVEGARQ